MAGNTSHCEGETLFYGGNKRTFDGYLELSLSLGQVAYIYEILLLYMAIHERPEEFDGVHYTTLLSISILM